MAVYTLSTLTDNCFLTDSAVLAHLLLKEKLKKLGMLGCVLCVVGSTIIVLHAPGEHSISSVEEIWELAIQPGDHLYCIPAVLISCPFLQ